MIGCWEVGIREWKRGNSGELALARPRCPRGEGRNSGELKRGIVSRTEGITAGRERRAWSEERGAKSGKEVIGGWRRRR
jgi:hypothetical protein